MNAVTHNLGPSRRAGMGCRIRACFAGLIGVLLLAGCASDSMESRRTSRYLPDTRDRDVSRWAAAEVTAAAIPDGVAATATTNVTAKTTSARPLRPGDQIIVYLGGIPEPMERAFIISDAGTVTLPHINEIRLEGLTTSQAEKIIQQGYLDGGIYTRISVSISVKDMAKEDQYFIGGEVKRPGNYPLRGDVSLLQAIATAGGYTEFAKARSILIVRKEENVQKNLPFDGDRIKDGKDKDPLLRPGDLITVDRWVVAPGIY